MSSKHMCKNLHNLRETLKFNYRVKLNHYFFLYTPHTNEDNYVYCPHPPSLLPPPMPHLRVCMCACLREKERLHACSAAIVYPNVATTLINLLSPVITK